MLTNSTVSGNRSDRRSGGILANGDVYIHNSTVTHNTARGLGGGVTVSQGELIVENSIIAGNTDDGAAPDLRLEPEVLATINHSLIGVADNLESLIDGARNLLGTAAIPLDPLLGPLADNGGPTQTHALLPGSPAIDGVIMTPTLITPFDQRGTPFLRLADGGAGLLLDMGAYEAQVAPSADFDADGDVDGADFLHWQRGFGKADALRIDGDSDGDSDNDASDLAAWRISIGQEQTLESLVTHNPATVKNESLVDAAMAWVQVIERKETEEPFVDDRAIGHDDHARATMMATDLAFSNWEHDPLIPRSAKDLDIGIRNDYYPANSEILSEEILHWAFL